MKLIERYLLRQMAGPTLAAVAALGGIGFLSQSLSNLDIIVEQRSSARVFVELTLLGLPLLFAMILPIAVLVAGFMTLSRLQGDQELIAAAASGISTDRIMAPAAIIGLIAMFLGLVSSLWVQPAAYRAIRQISYAARSDLATSLFRPGEFHTPSQDLTIYGRKFGKKGEIRDLYVYQQLPRSKAFNVYNALEGRLIRRDGHPLLLMRKGSTQLYSASGGLNYVSFDEYTLDLSPIVKAQGVVRYKMSDRYLSELFHPTALWPDDPAKQREAIAEGHARITAPLFSLAFALLAVAAILGGQFSRFGYGSRIATFAGIAAVGRISGFAAQAASGASVAANILQYVVPIALILIALGIVLPKLGASRVGASRLVATA
jgi:lipopolysaccharide export system permease protein